MLKLRQSTPDDLIDARSLGCDNVWNQSNWSGMDDESIRNAGILVVDDEEPIVRLIRRVLHSGGFEHHWGTSDPRQAVDLVEEFSPDLMILDIRMPHMDGFQVIEQVARLIPAGEYFPILVLTSYPSIEIEQRALSAGAKDFLIKPADPTRSWPGCATS